MRYLNKQANGYQIAIILLTVTTVTTIGNNRDTYRTRRNIGNVEDSQEQKYTTHIYDEPDNTQIRAMFNQDTTNEDKEEHTFAKDIPKWPNRQVDKHKDQIRPEQEDRMRKTNIINITFGILHITTIAIGILQIWKSKQLEREIKKPRQAEETYHRFEDIQ